MNGVRLEHYEQGERGVDANASHPGQVSCLLTQLTESRVRQQTPTRHETATKSRTVAWWMCGGGQQTRRHILSLSDAVPIEQMSDICWQADAAALVKGRSRRCCCATGARQCWDEEVAHGHSGTIVIAACGAMQVS